jgi:pyruvate/2-oxoacid:ferredoxin oxidoreductase beta subunit
MINFDGFDRKSFRKSKLDSKNKKRQANDDMQYHEHRLSKFSKQNLKKKMQEIQEEEIWEDWENEIH